MSAAFLKSPSVSIPNGSKTLTLTGAVDASFVSSGTAVIITATDGTRYDIVEGVKGSSANGSGISTITLRNAWEFPSIVDGKMTAFNTIEGLRDAIRRARETAAEAGQVTTIFGELITSTDPTIDVMLEGVTIQVTPYGYLQQRSETLIAELEAGAALLEDLEQEVINLSTDVAAQQSIVDANLAASLAARNAAEGHATTATTKASEASASATAAATSQTSAGNSATAAAASQTVATTKASEASASATAAAASETIAITKASEASASATAAAASQTVATTKASEASASATTAASERVLAETARDVAETFRNQSEIFSSIAESYANYTGIWSTLTGALTAPSSVFHNDAFWQLLLSIPDVTASEPSASNTDWHPIGASVTSVAGKTGAVTLVVDDVTGLTTALGLKANDNAVVKLTGAQSVAGVKTFSSIPVLPSSNPTTANQAVRKGHLDTVTADLTTSTASATANTLVKRNGDGNFSVNTPTDTNHPTTKGYVDSALGTDVAALQAAIDDVEILALAGL